MKTIIFLKKTDLIIQLGLYALLVGSILLTGEGSLLHYLLLTVWQLFSSLVHALFQRHYYVSVHRGWFLGLLLGTLLLMVPVAFINLVLLFVLVVMLIPILSMYYIITCFDELLILNRKAVVHLRR
jgi:hypothetical protein